MGQQFDFHLQNGLSVIGFEKNGSAGRYLLGRWESN